MPRRVNAPAADDADADLLSRRCRLVERAKHRLEKLQNSGMGGEQASADWVQTPYFITAGQDETYWVLWVAPPCAVAGCRAC